MTIDQSIDRFLLPNQCSVDTSVVSLWLNSHIVPSLPSVEALHDDNNLIVDALFDRDSHDCSNQSIDRLIDRSLLPWFVPKAVEVPKK